MARGDHGTHWVEYVVTAVMLVLALLFPVALMIFDPTLMFERGWEQYVGTGIYFWAVVTLGRELYGLWRNERAFEEAPELLNRVNVATKRKTTRDGSPSFAAIPNEDHRILPRRVRQLVSYLQDSHNPSVTQIMEVNREGSGLDQEQVAGRFTLTRYILYLLPVIGFIGTVEGISRALMNIGKVLPMVKELDGFLSNLTGVTSALQIAFDSTLLALFLSAGVDARADARLPPIRGVAGQGGPLDRGARPAENRQRGSDGRSAGRGDRPPAGRTGRAAGTRAGAIGPGGPGAG